MQCKTIWYLQGTYQRKLGFLLYNIARDFVRRGVGGANSPL